jgi:poly-gamma-glutamate synthase PgsB/CapB
MIVTISLLTIALAAALFFEYRRHLRHLKSIPIRIHVNGTRGKSSITRLISGALREYGLKTFAKTTGTLPRMITNKGLEYPVYRPFRANILEQLRIISFAAKNGAEALVIECMAVQPRLQSLTELKFVKATHGIITNARADHLDVMGPSERDVALALLGTTPCRGILFTAEQDYLGEFEASCRDRQSRLRAVTPEDVQSITDEEMSGFSYVEHKENVALVLKVCASLGISRDVALRGMWQSRRDPGAMSEHKIDFFGRKILFVNGFAANDPESSERIWRMAIDMHPEYAKRIMILNCRADRPDRSRQLGEALREWPEADHYVITGSGVYVLLRSAVHKGMDSSKFVYAEGLPVDRLFEEIIGLSGNSALVMGIGNIGGPGLELVYYFRNRSILS